MKNLLNGVKEMDAKTALLILALFGTNGLSAFGIILPGEARTQQAEVQIERGRSLSSSQSFQITVLLELLEQSRASEAELLGGCP